MINDRNFVYKTILLAKSKNFLIYDKNGLLNIIGVRNSSKRSDRWDDYIVAFRWMNNELEEYVFEASTDPGAYYLLNPLKATGTAILCPNIQVIGHYKLMDNGHKNYRAFKQIKPFPYIRDNNRDTILNFELFEDKKKWITNEIIGSNLHKASSNIITNVVGKYSAGCQVIRKSKDFEKLVSLGNEQIKITGIDTFNYGILWLNEIVNI